MKAWPGREAGAGVPASPKSESQAPEPVGVAFYIQITNPMTSCLCLPACSNGELPACAYLLCAVIIVLST